MTGRHIAYTEKFSIYDQQIEKRKNERNLKINDAILLFCSINWRIFSFINLNQQRNEKKSNINVDFYNKLYIIKSKRARWQSC